MRCPGLPKIAVHWPLIDFECGPVGGADDFIEWFFKADRGELEPFVLVVEGSIPNEAIKSEGYWCGFGNNPETGQPMTTSEWLDRLAPKALAVLAVGTCATYGGIHAMAGNPTGAMGVPDYLGWGWKSKAGIPIVCVPGLPGPPRQHVRDDPLPALPGDRAGADDPARRRAAAAVAVRRHGARGLRPRRLLRAGRLRHRVRLAEVHRQARLLGSGREVQRAQARLDERRRRLPERRRHLHRLHDAGLPRQVHAVHGRAARRAGVDDGQRRCTARLIRGLRKITAEDRRRGTEVADAGHAAAHRLQGRVEVGRWQPTTDRADARTAWSRWRGIRSPASSAASASTPRSTSAQGKVAECHSTSSIFRGYSIFMKGKDPRDAHFITSRICGICGDNHATCSCYAQNMAYGVHPPQLGERIVNLGEAAEYMFDHNIFQENLVGVDFCEKMVAETNPGVLEQANRTEAPHAGDHGYRPSATSCARSTRSRASSTARRCRSAGTRARCSA